MPVVKPPSDNIAMIALRGIAMIAFRGNEG